MLFIYISSNPIFPYRSQFFVRLFFFIHQLIVNIIRRRWKCRPMKLYSHFLVLFLLNSCFFFFLSFSGIVKGKVSHEDIKIIIKIIAVHQECSRNMIWFLFFFLPHLKEVDEHSPSALQSFTFRIDWSTILHDFFQFLFQLNEQ